MVETNGLDSHRLHYLKRFSDPVITCFHQVRPACDRDDWQVKLLLDAAENIEDSGMTAADNDSQTIFNAKNQADFIMESILLPVHTCRRTGKGGGGRR